MDIAAMTHPEVRARVEAVRDRFFADPGTTDLSEVRPQIARSWRRSVACGIDPAAPTIRVVEPLVDSVLLRAADTSLLSLESFVSSVGGAVSLADAHGALFRYRGAEQMIESAARVFPLRGTIVSEEYFGTNSDGIVLEERTASQVWGCEHAVESLRSSFCTSVPIFDPFRGSIRAVLSIMLPEQLVMHTGPAAALLTVQGAVAQIEAQLRAQLGSKEQTVFAHYLREMRKRGRALVLGFDGRNTFASEDTIWRLKTEDYAVLAGFSHEAQQSGKVIEREVTLSQDQVFRVTVRPIQHERVPVGSVLRLRSDEHVSQVSSGPASGTASRQLVAGDAEPSGLVGRSISFQNTIAALEEAVETGARIVLLGEIGTGKRELARLALRRLTPEVNVVTPDELDTLPPSSHAQDPHSGLIIDNASQSEWVGQMAVSELLARSPKKPIAVLARRSSPELRDLLQLGFTVIEVPPLRKRREDIPLLIEHALSLRKTDKYLSARLMESFTRGDWPGNVAQLLSVLDGLLVRTQSTCIDSKDLTPTEASLFAKIRLTRLEEVELEEIRQALMESDGNRVRAAQILEIGRSTLYRKIDQYSARGFEFNF